ncbi:hypothetical protein [Phycicoccus sonneratiae]|uniref:DUF1707 domain-containing protein n=1 Tax=Phycicoccus sonneratiae TaxID=2807628 RepID=A0ABS2CQ92_9MICO|nr:hypothetical protein [Phycicoccus sonneraticus]MBM6402059.1 hypothetical protein [Phycicoccus sonneraticus]
MSAVTSEQRTEDVRAYIGAVRAWLADLPADDVEELTFGMEADLAERAAEGDIRLGDLLGEPEEYAAELRSAAGLPLRTAPVEAPPSPGWLAEVSAAFWSAGTGAVDRWPWLRDLQPVWWVLRGLVAGWAVAMVLGTGHSVLLPALGAAASFVLRRWMAHASTPRGLRAVVVAGNVLAVVLLLPATLWYLERGAGDGPAPSDAYPAPGLVLDGAEVGNLYVYDAQGHRVEGARVLTQDGRGVYTNPTMLDTGPEGLPTRPDGSVDVATDVFPLAIGDRDPWSGSGAGWTPPLTLSPLPGATPASTDAASPAPSTTPAPTPSPTG